MIQAKATALLAVLVLALHSTGWVAAQQPSAKVVLPGNGARQFTIKVAPDADSLEMLAGRELSHYLRQITGQGFTVGKVDLFAAIKLPAIFVGKASPNYQSLTAGHDYNIIGTDAESLHIVGKTPQQTLEAVYIFLEHYAGCHFLSPQAEVVPRRKSLTIDKPYHYTPIAYTRTVHSKLFFNHPLFAAKRRVSVESFPGFVPIARVHTFHRLLPAATWLQTHPEYYAWVNGRRQPTQLCLSNDTVYHLVLDSVKAWFGRYPEASVLSVSQDDNTSYCTCPRCAATDAHEGSPAGSMIRFVNRIAANFPDKTISTLAYQYTRRAPQHTKPAQNVLVTLCSIECDRSGPIAQKCTDSERDLKAWKQTGATVKIWDYTTQFTNFLAPFPNLHTLQPNVQLFVENNARWLFEQHSHNPSELFELRSYLLAQLVWNPYASADSLYRGFTKNYYGKAAPFIERYIDTVHAALRQQDKFFLFLYGDPSQGFGSWLSAARLKQYTAWFDAAQLAVQSDTALLSRVKAARLGVDYALLEYCRRSEGEYTFGNAALVTPLLNRFEQATTWLNAGLINEMGLTTTDYIAAYRRLIANTGMANLASGKKVSLLTRPKKYAAENPQALTDGLYGGWSFYANWLGFEGNHMEAVVDLGQVQSFDKTGMHFLQVSNHLVFFPDSVSWYLSHDGQQYEHAGTIANARPLKPDSRINDIQLYQLQKAGMQARYIKLVAHNMKTPPIWHHGAGLGAWVFGDEWLITPNKSLP
jgi:hypothetical protein